MLVTLMRASILWGWSDGTSSSDLDTESRRGVTPSRFPIGLLGRPKNQPAGPQAHRVDARASSKCREPTSAMAVNEPGLGSSADGKGEKGIDRSLERTGTPLYLGE